MAQLGADIHEVRAGDQQLFQLLAEAIPGPGGCQIREKGSEFRQRGRVDPIRLRHLADRFAEAAATPGIDEYDLDAAGGKQLMGLAVIAARRLHHHSLHAPFHKPLPQSVVACRRVRKAAVFPACMGVKLRLAHIDARGRNRLPGSRLLHGFTLLLLLANLGCSSAPALVTMRFKSRHPIQDAGNKGRRADQAFARLCAKFQTVRPAFAESQGTPHSLPCAA